MAIPGITEIATQDLFLIEHIPKFTGEIWFVDAGVSASGTGGDPHQAFKTIGEAVTAASAGDAITVKAGTYTEDIDMNLDGLELWGEIGATMVGTLTVSGDSCRVRGMIIAPAAAVGIALTGDNCIIESTLVRGTPTTAFDIDGAQTIIVDSKAVGYTVTAFDVATTRAHLYRCLAQGADTSTRGFYLSNAAADACYLEHCTSIGNTTAGYELVTGVADVALVRCTSGSHDGRWVDADETNIFADFQFDDKLQKRITLTGAASYDLFKITGVVRVKFIYGTVEVALPAAVTAARLELFPTGGAAIAITLAAGTDISNSVTGTLLSKDNLATSALALHDATLGFVAENIGFIFTNFIIGQKTGGVETHIRFTRAGAGASGEIHWYIEWEPVSDDGFVLVA